MICIAGLLYWSTRVNLAYFDYTRQVWNPNALNMDAASGWEERLAILKGDLPDEGVIGFISDMDYPNLDYYPRDDDEEFVLSQYTLAPLILDRGSIYHELVVGNFGSDYDYQFQRDMGVSLIFNYGFGIYLFKGITE